MFITKVVEISLLKILLKTAGSRCLTKQTVPGRSILLCFAHEEYFCNMSVNLISHQQSRYVDSWKGNFQTEKHCKRPNGPRVLSSWVGGNTMSKMSKIVPNGCRSQFGARITWLRRGLAPRILKIETISTCVSENLGHKLSDEPWADLLGSKLSDWQPIEIFFGRQWKIVPNGRRSQFGARK